MDRDVRRLDAIRALRSGLAATITRLLMDCTAPVYWLRVGRGVAEDPVDNGTVFFIDMGAGPIALTAWHVVDGYRQAAALYPDLGCWLGSIPFNPSERLIAEDRLLEIATLRVSPAEIAAIEKVAHTAPSWPPRIPQPTKGVFFGGYPGTAKERVSGGFIWDLAHVLETAYSVHEDHITIKFERESWVCNDLSRPPPPGFHWGGVSGGPVFAFRDGSVVSWQLAGLIYEFNVGLEVFFASTLSSVTPDGSILPSPRRLTRTCI